MNEPTINELFPIHTTIKKVKKTKLFTKRCSGSYDLLPSSTSGDTSNHQVFIKKEEESHLLAPDQLKMPVGAAAIISDSLPVEIAYIDSCSEQEDIKRNNDDMKEAAGDSYDKKVDNDYLVNNESSINKTPDTSAEKKEDGDKVNGAFINMPTPPDKAWKSNTSTAEEDCNITCLYYTLQCCDCVIS